MGKKRVGLWVESGERVWGGGAEGEINHKHFKEMRIYQRYTKTELILHIFTVSFLHLMPLSAHYLYNCINLQIIIALSD